MFMSILQFYKIAISLKHWKINLKHKKKLASSLDITKNGAAQAVNSVLSLVRNFFGVGGLEEWMVTVLRNGERQGKNMRQTIQNHFHLFYFKLQRLSHTLMNLYLTRSAEGRK